MSLTRRVFIQRIAQMGGYSAAFSAMRALGLTADPGLSPLPQLAPDFGKGKKVVILGAGIAGSLAWILPRRLGLLAAAVQDEFGVAVRLGGTLEDEVAGGLVGEIAGR